MERQPTPPTEAADVTIRRVRADDLAALYDIWYHIEVGDHPNPPPHQGVLPDHQHILDTGVMYLAERNGVPLGFAGAVTRGNVTFLTDLFVSPRSQSNGVGAQLLHAAFRQNERRIRCTVSSNDPRALSLYIRAGMQPQWPNFLLRRPSTEFTALPEAGVEVVEGNDDDPDIVSWDAAISGRVRPQDHVYWMVQEGGIPLWFRRRGQTIGYAYVRLTAGTLWQPDAARVGPVGAHTPEDAAACVFGAVRWAASHAKIVRIDVPGPHESLASLLDAGFIITYVETFVSSATAPFFDARLYVGSGGSLL
jgi:GNAT superfamily N-acetyltransferase